MTLSKQLTTATLIAAMVLSTTNATAADTTTDLWRGMNTYISRATAPLNRIKDVSSRSTVFGFSISMFQTKQGLREQIDQIMVQSANVLGGSELTRLKRKVNDVREIIMGLRQEQTTLSGRLALAPEQRNWYHLGILVSTKAEIEKRIQDIDGEILAKRQEIVETRKQMIDVLLASNSLTNKDNIERQVDALLYTVTGDNDIQLISAYENLKKLTQSLEELIDKSPTDAARKNYFGQYALLVRALIAFHQDYLNKVTFWNSRLIAVKVSSEKLIQDARRTLRSITGSNEVNQRQTLQLNANIRMNERVIALVGRYQNYLKQSEERVKRGLGPLYTRYEVAELTYNTFQNIIEAGSIIQEIRETSGAFLSLELPEMAISVDSINLDELENLNMQLMR